MATNSVQYDNYLDSLTGGATFNNRSSDIGGKVRCSRFDLEFSASAAGTTLNLTTVPAGATFLFAILSFEGTASLTLDIGDAGDPDRLVTAAALATDSPTTGGIVILYGRMDSTAFGVLGPDGNQSSAVSVGIGYKYTARTVITGLTAGATATAGEVLRGAIFYTVE